MFQMHQEAFCVKEIAVVSVSDVPSSLLYKGNRVASVSDAPSSLLYKGNRDASVSVAPISLIKGK